MNLPFLYLLGIVLVTRLFWVFRDERASGKVLLIAAVIRLASLLPILTGGPSWLLVPGVLVLSLLQWRIELNHGERPRALYGARIFMLSLWILFLGVLCSRPFSVNFSSRIREWFSAAGSYHVFISGVPGPDRAAFLAYFVGAMLAVAESHVVVRYVLEYFDLKPAVEAESEEVKDQFDEAEYNRGRIIGCLERFIAFTFILHGAFTALVFVVAVKNLTRFKQLDKRPFAEYFLIGTLLSIICAGVAAAIIQMFFAA